MLSQKSVSVCVYSQIGKSRAFLLPSMVDKERSIVCCEGHQKHKERHRNYSNNNPYKMVCCIKPCILPYVTLKSISMFLWSDLFPYFFARLLLSAYKYDTIGILKCSLTTGIQKENAAHSHTLALISSLSLVGSTCCFFLPEFPSLIELLILPSFQQISKTDIYFLTVI